MIKINSQLLIRSVDAPELDMSDISLERLKRDIDHGYKRFCERRGINPDNEGFAASVRSGINAAMRRNEE